MKTVRYTGSSHIRKFAASDFAPFGLAPGALVFDRNNGWEAEVADDVAAFLLTQGDFSLSGSDDNFADLVGGHGKEIGYAGVGTVFTPGDVTTPIDVPGAVVNFTGSGKPVYLEVDALIQVNPNGLPANTEVLTRIFVVNITGAAATDYTLSHKAPIPAGGLLATLHRALRVGVVPDGQQRSYKLQVGTNNATARVMLWAGATIGDLSLRAVER